MIAENHLPPQLDTAVFCAESLLLGPGFSSTEGDRSFAMTAVTAGGEQTQIRQGVGGFSACSVSI